MRKQTQRLQGRNMQDCLRNRKEASAAGVEEDGEGDVSEHFKKVMGVGYETSKEACSRSNKSLLNFF